MTQFTNWLISMGISQELLTILVFVPIILTLSTFSRYITGIKTFGIYGAMVLAIAYYFMGLIPGLILTLIIVLSAWMVQKALKRVRLHYLSRLAVIYCVEIVLIILIFAMFSFFLEGVRVNLSDTLSPLAVVMMISITDRFVANYTKKDLFTAIRLTVETVIIALLSWGIMSLAPVSKFLVNNLWTIPVMIVINFLVGKYLNFRWIELIRFNQVTKNVGPSGENTEK